MKPSETFPFGHPGAFGAPGPGGSMGFADPEVGVGYGYVTNRMGTALQGDPREVALREAMRAGVCARRSGLSYQSSGYGNSTSTGAITRTA